ncbi:alpha/beta fold hydrolase [Streptacidiphilus sp. ASG 303]|uniref:alpha/beta fold hydrolase n=1 Tax=Streptacidiphilus sp. ASG 303 TaxID=2896847 RepID=UPI001E2828E2|nr:alpha/beta fold hydrolase [Streptacidiphilus sp. ASG 303]MCD0482515.1 alpha/beta fold hydrolase [Streptacidiphilus sp. ASG 303]
MTLTTRTAAPALRRVSFTFAADGSHAACLAAADGGGWYAESWRLDRPGAAPAPVPLPPAGRRSESLQAQLVALADGRVLVCRHDGELHRSAVLSPEGEQPVGTLRAAALRLLPVPVPPGAGPGAPVAVALAGDARHVTTVWLVAGDGSAPRRAAELAGLFGGGVWLDRQGRLLALDRVAGGTVRSVALDLADGTVSPLLEIAEGSSDRLVLFDPDTRLAVVRSDAPGTDRLGWGVLGAEEPLRFPECLHVPGALVRPVAVEAAASPGPAAERRVAVQLDRGAGSALALWRPSGGGLELLPAPAGRFGAVAHWSRAGLRIPYSAPDHPAALATLDVDAARRPAAAPVPPRAPQGAPPPGTPFPGTPSPDTPSPDTPPGPPGWRLDGSAGPGGGRWHPAAAVELCGAAGPMEAVVYGGAGWSTARHLVVALHGGPADAWRLEFDPTLQRLAAEGLAVVAPNQRGSTGYGPEHALCLHGAWGGPDLEDVLALLADLAPRRAALGLEPPALFGISYGAFLALLAAAHAPDGHVSRCAAVAPFLSGARLLAEAAAPVRALTARLGGGATVDDARGPRDVLEVCHRITAPLLVVHGDRDEVVPVAHSRALRERLLRAGRAEGSDFRCVESAGAGHELLAEEGAPVVRELLAGFLRTGRPS